MSQRDKKPVSAQFSYSIRLKTPRKWHEATSLNAFAILRSPTRLSTEEKDEVVRVAAGMEDWNKGAQK